MVYPKKEKEVNIKKCVCSGKPCPQSLSSSTASSSAKTKKESHKAKDKDKGIVKKRCTNATCKCKRKKKKQKKKQKPKSDWMNKPCKSGNFNTGLDNLLSPLCFPCFTVWRICASSSSSTNDCFLYWLCAQWILCKLERGCSIDQVLFPYYVYLFAQIMLFGVIFYLFWHMFGRSIILPLFYSTHTYMQETAAGKKKYCFSRKELFPDEYKKKYPNGPPPTSAGSILERTSVETLIVFVFDVFLSNYFFTY